MRARLVSPETVSVAAKMRSNVDVRVLSAWLFAFLCSVYLFVYSGNITISDEINLMATTESLAKRGEYTANPTFWKYTTFKIEGGKVEVVPDFEPLQSLLAAPLAWVALHVPHVGLIHLATIFNVLVTALTAVVVMGIVTELGYSGIVSLGCALIFGLCTIAFPYTKMFFREPLSGLFIAAALFCLVRWSTHQKPVWAPWSVLCLIGAYLAKEASLFAVPIFVWAYADLALPAIRPHVRQYRFWLVLALVIAALVLVGIVFASRMDTRGFGGRTLVLFNAAISRMNMLPQVGAAILGYLISPGKSFFVFTPISLATLWVFPRFLWLHRREAVLIAGLLLFALVGYAIIKWDVWWGGLAWGPRFLVPVAPLVAIPLAPLLRDVMDKRARIQRLMLSGLLGASLFVQVVGSWLDIRAYGEMISSIQSKDQTWSSIWEIRYSPVSWALPMLTRSDNWNFSWARYLWGRLQAGADQLDWFILGICIAFVAVTLVLLWRALNRQSAYQPVAWLTAWAVAVLLTGAVVGTVVYTIYPDDPRYYGGADRQQLLLALDNSDGPGDVLIVNDETLVRFVMNYSHSAIDWFSVRPDDELSAQAQSLVDNLMKFNSRLWLMLNYSPKRRTLTGLEQYITLHAYPIQQQVFSDYAQLALYSTVAAPDSQAARRPVHLLLGSGIELDGFDLSNNALSEIYRYGSYAQLSLLWRTRQSLTKNYTVFAQLIAPEGQLVWQADRQPADGFRPTSSWAIDQPIRDNYGFIIQPEWAPGDYHLIAGMYEYPALKRLPVQYDGGARDYIDLATIAIR